MKFILVEDTLNEETMYQLDTGPRTFYFVAGDRKKFNSVADVCKYLETQRKNKEAVNVDLLSELSSYSNRKFKLTKVDESNIDYDDERLTSRLINTTFRTSRNRSHNTLVNTKGNDSITVKKGSIVVHHIDGIEKNNDKNNLMGLPSKDVHSMLHLLRLTKKGTSFEWQGDIEVLLYDGTAYKKRILKVTATV